MKQLLHVVYPTNHSAIFSLCFVTEMSILLFFKAQNIVHGHRKILINTAVVWPWKYFSLETSQTVYCIREIHKIW